jgi:ribose transport system permease protein
VTGPAGRSAARSRRALKGTFGLQRAGVVYAFVVIVVVLELLTVGSGLHGLLTVANVRNILDQSALDGVLVIPMTCLLITGNFDLSIGATAGLAAGLGLSAANHYGSWTGAVAALAVGVAVGMANGGLVQWVGINAFIVTLGTLTAVQGILLLVSNGNTILASGNQFGNLGSGFWSLPRSVPLAVGALLAVSAGALVLARSRGRYLVRMDGALVLIAGTGILLVAIALAFPALFTETRETWLMFAYMIVVALVLRYTVLGRRLYAVGGNPEAARLSGISLARYRVSSFMLCGLSAGFAGMLYAGKFGAVIPSALSTEELPVLAAAILGGTSLFGGSGYVAKSVLGVLILQTLTNGFALLNLGANLQYLVQGLVIIAAAAVYTIGTVRRRASRATIQLSTAPPSAEASVPTAPDGAADAAALATGGGLVAGRGAQ